ncbi:hypothetical protein AC249_AIPGENE11042 [Exaiptasia diaphana]|nr:hypothetical protein AC249_AIPGENE11042 [Exaiptasia diaphana]
MIVIIITCGITAVVVVVAALYPQYIPTVSYLISSSQKGKRLLTSESKEASISKSSEPGTRLFRLALN